MAHGLEVRSPLCDFELAAYVLSLPPEYRLKGTRSKHILKEVSRRWLPREIVERPKVGFDSPIGQWFKEELRPFLMTFLSPSQVDRSGLLNGPAVQRLVGEHLGGVRDYSMQIWSIVALEAWFRMYIDGSGSDRREPALGDLRGASAVVAPAEGAA
jgi:asparagine synthase (glutamine-hydrolysing)